MNKLLHQGVPVKFTSENIAGRILSAGGIPPAIEITGGQAGFLLAWMSRDPVNRACVAVLRSAAIQGEALPEHLKDELYFQKYQADLKDFGKAVEKLREMGLLVRKHATKRLCIPEYDGEVRLSMDRITQPCIYPFTSERMRPYCRFEDGHMAIDGIALAFAYVLCWRDERAWAAFEFMKWFGEFLYRSLLHKWYLPKREYARYVRYEWRRSYDYDFCDKCLRNQHITEKEVDSAEVAVAVHKLLNTVTGKAELALLRKEWCFFDRVKERDARFLRATRNHNVWNARARVEKVGREVKLKRLTWKFEEEYEFKYGYYKPWHFIDYPPPAIVVTDNLRICMLAASYAVTKLDERDMPDIRAARGILRSTAWLARSGVFVDDVKEVVKLVMKVAGDAEVWKVVWTGRKARKEPSGKGREKAKK